MWKQINQYYLENNGWTICKTGKTLVRYGLYQGSINRGWFDTSAEAIAKWEELTA
jgi:hypothetical protein